MEAPFRYFKTLPVLVQSLLIVLLIMLLFPRFKDTILEVLKALKMILGSRGETRRSDSLRRAYGAC